MNYNVKGYLTISDDVILFQSSMLALQNSVIWFTPFSQLFIVDIKAFKERKNGKWNHEPTWSIWGPNRQHIHNAMDRMQSSCNISVFSTLCKCSLKLKELFGGLWRLPGYNFADIWYIPDTLMEDFGVIADVFFTSGVYFEVGITTALSCLGLAEHFQELKGAAVCHIFICFVRSGQYKTTVRRNEKKQMVQLQFISFHFILRMCCNEIIKKFSVATIASCFGDVQTKFHMSHFFFSFMRRIFTSASNTIVVNVHHSCSTYMYGEQV